MVRGEHDGGLEPVEDLPPDRGRVRVVLDQRAQDAGQDDLARGLRAGAASPGRVELVPVQRPSLSLSLTKAYIRPLRSPMLEAV
jgi:hypothetical protein